MDVLEEQIRQDPDREDRLNKMESFIQNFQMVEGQKAVTTIPVVVHVVYRTSTENISLAQINSQLQVLNDDFRRLNGDADGTWSQAADSEIEFCLATVDPNGNATDGVIRQSTTRNGFGTNDAVKSASSGGSNAWPAGQYMNMWVCNIGGGILGYAQFPGGPASTDGVVVDYRYFGTTGTATAPFNLGRTGTHEVGHYLNLRHIWGDTGCGGDDFVSDTPLAGSPNYTGSPCNFPGPNTCNTGAGDEPDMFQNYMDYSDDACMNLFTTGQKSRMQATLAGFRSGLGNSNGCGTPGGGPTCTDGIQNGDETGVDCGGTSCAPCSSSCADTEVTLNLITDNYASETSWTLSGPSGTVATGSGYANNTSYSETFCLPDGCYTFTINDTYGDGICCAYGSGSYSLTNDGTGASLGSGGNFTFSATEDFCLGGGPAPTCTDGVQNGDETGVDCGGSCAPCATCDDGILNGNETDVDCGGSCAPCATCNDGVQNGDETGVDCGGSCAPCGGGGCTETVLSSDGFESSYGNWNDGGSDCARTSTYAESGNRSIRLRDNTNSSVLTSDPYNLTGFSEVTISFDYLSRLMENGEDFWLQANVGGGYQTLVTWVAGTDFTNSNTNWTAETVTITGTFSSSTRFRFRCDASANSDYIYLDNIVVEGCQPNNSRETEPVVGNPANDEWQQLDDEDDEVYYRVFPNPARSEFNVNIDAEGYTARLTSMEGKLILNRQLNEGSNRITVDELPRGMYLLIIEGAEGFRKVEKVVLNR